MKLDYAEPHYKCAGESCSSHLSAVPICHRLAPAFDCVSDVLCKLALLLDHPDYKANLGLANRKTSETCLEILKSASKQLPGGRWCSLTTKTPDED